MIKPMPRDTRERVQVRSQYGYETYSVLKTDLQRPKLTKRTRVFRWWKGDQIDEAFLKYGAKPE